MVRVIRSRMRMVPADITQMGLTTCDRGVRDHVLAVSAEQTLVLVRRCWVPQIRRQGPRSPDGCQRRGRPIGSTADPMLQGFLRIPECSCHPGRTDLVRAIRAPLYRERGRSGWRPWYTQSIRDVPPCALCAISGLRLTLRRHGGDSRPHGDHRHRCPKPPPN